MCKVVIRRELLGSREQCWSLWSGKDVLELTSKQIKDIIKAGKEKICGLKIGESGELEMDAAGFFTHNIMEHRLGGNFQPMNSEDSMANMMYTVIGKHEEAGKVVYECISNRFEQAKLSEDEVKAYIRIGIIASGARLTETGEIEVASLEYPKEQPKEAAETKVEPVVETKLEEKKPEPVAENPLDDTIVSVEKVEVKPAGKGKK